MNGCDDYKDLSNTVDSFKCRKCKKTSRWNHLGPVVVAIKDREKLWNQPEHSASVMHIAK